MRYFFLLIAIGSLTACSPKTTRPTPGYYQLRFQTENGVIPARLDITDAGEWNILNAEELIQLDSVVFTGDSFFVKLPLFDSSMKGTWRNDSLIGEWTDHSRKDYHIPFAASISTSAGCENTIEEFRYDVTFSPGDSSEMSKGVAVLLKHGQILTGTVLTETGDYRYLQGEWNNDSLWLSAFDGTHLFYLSGKAQGDSITNGIFLSGKHWKESWVAVKSNTNMLRDPSSITTATTIQSPQFDVLTNEGKATHFDSTSWNNHVSIVQIMGSWCPNCTDESRFLKTLYDEYHERGLNIIPVAFERGDDVTAASARVQKQFSQLGLTYPFYYGGQANKAAALSTFSFLDEVHSFPTTIFIDRKGNVRKVFTGFYGPGTGQDYTVHTKSIHSFVDSLINE
ncbi:MAG: TlpA family protein disulfide reductase [Flavobacteriales bacterium]